MTTTSIEDEKIAAALAMINIWHGVKSDRASQLSQIRQLNAWHKTLSTVLQDFPDFSSESANYDLVLDENRETEVFNFPMENVAASRIDEFKQPRETFSNISIAETARNLQTGRVSSVELTVEAIERLETIAKNYNAVISIDVDQAFRAANCADTARIGNDLKLTSLSGIPLAHKALFQRFGRIANAGSALFKNRIATRTASALHRLDKAGAVDLGYLHTSELALDAAGLVAFNGPSINPWDESAISGGSSSGSAIAVATRAVFGSLGSDTGGSVRIPSAICGVTGLKPTFNLISCQGVIPVSKSCDHVGILAGSAQDCAQILNVVARTGQFSSTNSCGLPAPTSIELLDGRIKGLRIGVPQRFFHTTVCSSVKKNLAESLGTLEELGAVLYEVPDFPYEIINSLGSLLLQTEAAAVHLQALRDIGGRLSHVIRERLELGLGVPALSYKMTLDIRGNFLRDYLKTVMADIDILHTPVISIPTPHLMQHEIPTISRREANELTRLTRPFNFLGLPAMSVPCGFYRAKSGRNLPQGFQLVGKPFSERVLLSVGAAYQETTGWHLCKP